MAAQGGEQQAEAPDAGSTHSSQPTCALASPALHSDLAPTTAENGVRRGRGTGKIGTNAHPWDAFFEAPKAASTVEGHPPNLPLEDATDAIVSAGAEGVDSNAQLERFGLFNGDSWRNVPGPDGKLPDERVSHLMCRVLRYHTETLGLTVDEDGWVSIADLLASMPELEDTTEEDVRRVVKDSVGPKGARFELREKTAEEETTTELGPQVRATYKHPKDGRRLYGARGPRRHPGSWGLITPWPANGRGWHPSQGAMTPDGYHRPGFSRPPPPGCVDDDDEVDGQTSRLESAACRPLAIDHLVPDHSARQQKQALSAASEDASRPERWERYLESQTHNAWFWNEATDEVFFADDPNSGWERFEDAEGRPWWWHEVQGRFFFEEA